MTGGQEVKAPKSKGAHPLRRHLLRKGLWYLGALLAAVLANFLLPRLVPGNPVDALVAQVAGGGGLSGAALERIYNAYVEEFALDQPIWRQLLTYVGNLLQGDLGKSFSAYPRSVSSLIAEALPWSVALQLPAILIGWLLGNVLGTVAAYRGGWVDRGGFLMSQLISSIPYYCFGILLVYVFAVVLQIFPAGGGYSYFLTPAFSAAFLRDALHHFWLPFLSLTIVFVGGQAVGMRSMAIYELNSDYVNYVRSLGVGGSRVMRYIFRNAALPQVTGLALSIGTLVGGAILTEAVFSYPGIGSLLFGAIRTKDYPLISGITLVIAVTVLLANFLVEVAYGLIDPRVRAGQAGER